jgi:hypothetical protein
MTKSFFKYAGGDTVKYGFYWNVREWEAQVVPKEGGTLGGEPDVRYIRMPLFALLVLAPIMGAIYAFFLPFIGFAMLAMFLVGRLRSMITGTPPAIDASARASASAHHNSPRKAA